MAEKKFAIPEVLPILPVRDTVLFPGAMLPLTVGRESSLALVGSLQGEEKLLGVVAQLDPRIEDPAAADALPPGADCDAERAQSSGNPDPRIIQGAGSSGTALENPRAGAGAGQPKPARISAARANEGHSKRAGRIGRFDAGNRRTAQK